MKLLARIVCHPAFHLVSLMLVWAYVFSKTVIDPQDDDPFYQSFIESLAQGRVDLTIPGFQGASFLAVMLHLIAPSEMTNAYFQVGCAFLLPLAAYYAASGLFRDRVSSILFTYCIALMPFLGFVGFQGFTFPSFTLLIFLTIGLYARGSMWAFLPWAIAVITKPFGIALLPLFLLWRPSRATSIWGKGWVQVLLMLPIPILYVVTQYLQVGHIIVGSHPDITQSNVFVWWRFPLNAAHGIQMLFSIHNFYFPDPSKTGQGNLLHSSPLLMLFGIISLLYAKQFWKDLRLAKAIGIGFVFAYCLAALLDHMDHFYMELSVIFLVFASIPFMLKYRLLIPIALATLHFQFFYLYLSWRGMYFTDYSFFLIPLFIDIMALLTWVIVIVPRLPGGVRGYIRNNWGAESR